MNSQQVQDMRLMYEAVYNDELWELANEYNNTIYDEDIVEVATEYFYTYGLNEDGIDILIEKVGLDNFVEFVYDLSEDLTILAEERSAKKRTGGESYADVKAKIDAKEAAKKKAKEEALKRKESERMEPASNGADTESKKEQPKSKKPLRDALAKRILDGMERHRQATQTAGRLAGETGRTLGRIASLAGEAGRRGVEHVKKHGMKSLANEEVEAWVNQLVEEGYDLSEYTWEEMYEAYLNESGWHRRNPDQIGSSNDPDVRMRPERSSSSSSSSDKKPTWTPLDDKKEYRRTVYNNYGKTGREDAVKRAKNTRDALRKKRRERGSGNEGGTQKESFDLFNTILEHLIAEGYADTNESALAIMANMSEEWRQSIVEGPGGMMMSAASQGKGRIVKTQPERGPRPSQSGSAMGRKPVDPSRRLQPPVGATVNRYDSAGKPYTHIQK